MREFSKVGIGFWDSPAITDLDDKGKLLALYLATCKHGNSAGMFMLRDGYVMADLEWDAETVREQFANLSEVGYASRCDRTSWVVVHKALKHNRFENAKSASATANLIQSIPDTATIWPEIAEAIRAYWPEPYAEIGKKLIANAATKAKRSRTVSEPEGGGSRNASEQSGGETETETETETESTTSGPSDADRDYPPAFEAMWSDYPKRLGDNPKRKAFRAWGARVKEGHTPAELHAGVTRYARFVDATGKTGTETVKHAATFFGPDKPFLEPWVCSTKNHQEALEETNRRKTAGWRPSEIGASDATH